MAAYTYFNQVQQLYIAYFGRPADTVGLAYWAANIDAADGGVAGIIAGFSASKESQVLYAGATTAQKVSSIYLALFNRNPEAAGLAYWVAQIDSGTVSQAQAAYQIQSSAGVGDATAVANKLAAANAFTEQLDTTAEVAGYVGSTAAAYGRAYLSGVDATPWSLATATAAATLNNTVAIATGTSTTTTPVIPPPPPTFGTLTIGNETINDAAMTGAHTYNAILGTGATLNAGDLLTGNGLATLAITDTTAGGHDSLIGISLAGIETVTLTTAGNAGTDSTHAFDLSGDGVLTSFTLTASGNLGDYVKVGSGVDLTIASASSTIGVTGSGSLTLTDDAVTSLTLAGNLSISSFTLGHDAVSVVAGTDDAIVHLTTQGIGAAGSAASLPGLSGDAGTVGGGSTVNLGNGADVITIGDSGGAGGSGGNVDSNNDFLNGGTGGTGGDGGHDTVTLGDGNNSITDNSAGGAGGVGGSVTGALLGLFRGGNGGNGGNGGHNSITVGNGDNTITDNSTGGAGGTGGTAGLNGATGTTGTGGNDTITVGTGHNIIDLGGHGNDRVILGTDGGSLAQPNQIIKNAAAGDIIGFALNPGTLSFPSFSSSAGTVADFISDLKAAVSGIPGGVAFGTFTDNNTYLVETLNGNLDSANLVIIEITGVHSLGAATANTLELIS